jgi:ATP-dependent helicase/DNAse subunit B
VGLFKASLHASPVLVVPNLDEAFRFERELCGDGAVLGGSVKTFDGLFAMVAATAGTPAPPRLTRVQRLRLVEAAITQRRGDLGPLRRSSQRPGFAASLERLLGELQAAGLDQGAVEAGAATIENAAYLGDLAGLLGAYEATRARTGRADSHGIARDAIRALADEGDSWGGRPVFVYGLDDLTRDQLELLRRLSEITEVTIALPHEQGRSALAARSGLVERLRESIGVAAETAAEPEPGNTSRPLLYGLERSFADPDAEPLDGDDGLTFLRSAGQRGEAEAIAAVVGRLLHDGAKPDEVAIVLRDPARRGPLLAGALESYGIPVALEADLPVSSTGVGGALLALLETEHGSRRAADVLRWLRGPSGTGSESVDWLERAVRRSRAVTAAEALELWTEKDRELPYDLRRIREAGPAGLIAEVAEAATRMATRFLAGEGDGPEPGRRDGAELRAAATIAGAMAELTELGDLAPDAGELIGFLRELNYRVWSGPVEARVRIAGPQQLRAGRFDHVVIGSLQDGEFPLRGSGDPFLSDELRESLELDPRRDDEAEERYLFYASISLARESLVLSYRDSDEGGGAEARSPLIDDVRRLLAPPPPAEGPDPVEEAITRARGLADLVHPAAEAPSADELARSVAAQAREAEVAALLDAASPSAALRKVVEERISAARVAEEASRAPGPLRNPAVLERLGSVPAYGGTTLELFDECSYRWFTDHELSPQPLDPLPEGIVQGGLMHRVLERLYGEAPGGDSRPRPSSLPNWVERGSALVAEEAPGRGVGGGRPVERAIRRRVERLLSRFLGEEAAREGGVFEPWLLEAGFGEDERSLKPPLEIDGWRLHGQIDRADRAPDGRVLVHDYKVSSSATPAKKLEEKAKLQLQLYLLAAEDLWGGTPAGGLYHPLRGTRERRPRGLVLEDDVEDLPPYGLVGTDELPRDRFEALLADARLRASAIVSRMRAGEIDRDPGPADDTYRNHDVCPTFCEFAPICRRDRSPIIEEEREREER